MEIDKGPSKVYDKKKKTDEHGQYPAWMNQRAIQKQQLKNKKVKRKKGKKASAWWCTSDWEHLIGCVRAWLILSDSDMFKTAVESVVNEGVCSQQAPFEWMKFSVLFWSFAVLFASVCMCACVLIHTCVNDTVVCFPSSSFVIKLKVSAFRDFMMSSCQFSQDTKRDRNYSAGGAVIAV